MRTYKSATSLPNGKGSPEVEAADAEAALRKLRAAGMKMDRGNLQIRFGTDWHFAEETWTWLGGTKRDNEGAVYH